jgi:hypothetical protein
MAAPIKTTLLALCLALMRLEAPLSKNEQEELTDVVRQLDNSLDDWEFIEDDLTKIITRKALLDQLYQEAKTRLNEVDGNIPPNLLPTEIELEQVLPINSRREERPYKPSRDDNEKSYEIINTTRKILNSSDPVDTTKNLPSLKNLWQFLNQCK